LPTSSSGASVPNPWKALDRLGLVLERAPIPERGRYYHHERVIVVRRGLRIVEERAILWHEIAHAVRGDVQCLQGPLDRRQEVACWRYAARRAIPLRALLEALRWSDQTHEVADQLKTTEEMLEVRLVALHPAERGACRRVVQGRS
jgi:hypothetical protein